MAGRTGTGAASVAKVTAPRITGYFPRRNLFRLLDAARKRPVIWISAPAGSGKTTLVGSYIETRGLSCLWYQVDEGDVDPASFFYYMGLAARRAAPRNRTPLPLLSPEYHPNLSVFSLRYFERLYARLKPGSVLVFDNCQKVPPESFVHDVLREGLSALPKGLNAILISRGDPPPAFARDRAHRTMEVMGWEELRLTHTETEGIARLRRKRKVSKETARMLHGRTDGWAAGLVLILEQTDRHPVESRRLGERSPEELFDYFAEEVFGRLEENVRAFLLRSVFLERTTVGMAEKLAGEPRAGLILSYLSRNNYFTQKHLHGEPVYEYHSLFREFLLARAKAALPAQDIALIQREAADLLAGNGQLEAAVALYRECGAWEEAMRIVLSQASSLVAQGRYRTLGEWLAAIPKSETENNPWIDYWTGASRLPFEPRESRKAFEEAFRRFYELRDVGGVFLAWSGIAESIMYGHEGLKPLDRWFSLLDGLMNEFGDFPSEEIGARVTCSMIRALALRRPPYSAMERWADRAHHVSQTCGDLSVRIEALVNMAIFRYAEGNLRKLEFLLDTLRETVKLQDVPPIARLTVNWLEAAYANLASCYEMGMKAVSEGLALSGATGVHVMDYMLMGQGVLCSLKTGDFPTAGRYLGDMAASLPSAKPWEASFYHYAAAWEALLRGETAHADLHSSENLRLCEEVGNPWTVYLSHSLRGFLFHAAGENGKAADSLSMACQTGAHSRNEYTRFLCLLSQSYFYLQEGNESAALLSLREGMRVGRENGYVNLYMWQPGVIEGIMAKALDAGIETAYAQDLIRRNALVPDRPLDAERWPYPFEVFTLGRFDLVKYGERIPVSKKVQQKPLQMLKALITLGGSEIAEETITDLLWPDSEGDLAHQAFTSTLHRLRKLVGDEKAIALRDGRLTLSDRHGWVDAWAFERLIEQAGNARKRDAGRDGGAEILRMIEKAVGLYKGPFLPEETKHPKAVSLRERLRSKFLRAVETLGRHWESADEWEKAVDCYRRGIEAESLAEEFYRCLIVCYRRLGRDAEAHATYRACRNVLSASLGIAPSPGTESVYRATYPSSISSRKRNRD
ncbi:MAG: hypothetical protein HY896_02915 [Deltaproteobacteria bacterium]|nr:hypothetical protein [Deltaproteobacteria bacterium]